MLRACLIALPFVVAFLSLAPPTLADPPAKYALLVAVTRYNHAEMNKPQLKFPEADAKALGKVLEESGYHVEYLLGADAKREAIAAKLSHLSDQGNADGVVLVGLFGHGVAIVERDATGAGAPVGYYCPFDTKVRTATQADGRPVPGLIEPEPKTMVSLGDVTESLRSAGAPSRVVVADCCREIANRARGRSLDFGAGFSVNNLPDGAAVLFDCAPGERAFEHDGWGHGAFTKCLLDELANLSTTGKATTGTLIDRLKEKVPALVKTKAAPGEKQSPKPFFTDSVDLQLKSVGTRPDIANAEGKKAGELSEITLPDNVKLKMVWLEGGRFNMGSNDGADAEKPVHSVQLDGFWLGQTEITQEQWKAVMGTEPWKGADCVKEGAKFAATYVSHNDAAEFCRKLSEIERKAGHLPAGWKYSLPTEAQWEYGCRAGSQTKYSFGDDYSELGEYAWYTKNAWDVLEKFPHEVAKKKPNRWGVYDMHGNVWEWCADWYENKYPSDALANNPSGPASGAALVLRGGAWDNNPQVARSAHRNFNTPDNRSDAIGFRVSRTR